MLTLITDLKGDYKILMENTNICFLSEEKLLVTKPPVPITGNCSSRLIGKYFLTPTKITP